MSELLHTPVFAILLTLASCRLAEWISIRCKRHPLAHPFLLAAVPVVLVLKLTDLDYAAYFDNARWLHLLLGPATVALAWPLYQQLRHIRQAWKTLLFTTLLGASLAVLITTSLAWLCDAPTLIRYALAPKSITTPIALEISKFSGADASLTAGVVVITGVVGAIFAPIVFRWLRIEDDRIRGFTLGLTAHAIGTARAFEYSPRAGAFAGLALGLTGTATALLLPAFMQWL